MFTGFSFLNPASHSAFCALMTLHDRLPAWLVLTVLNVKHVVMMALFQFKTVAHTLGFTWKKLLVLTGLGLSSGLFLALTIPLKVS
jgi:hypothetical protein